MPQQLETAIRLTLAAQVRNRLAWMLLVAFVPVWYLLIGSMIPGAGTVFRLRASGAGIVVDGHDLTLVTAGLSAITLITGFVVFAAVRRSLPFDRRLVLSGYRHSALVAAKTTAALAPSPYAGHTRPAARHGKRVLPPAPEPPLAGPDSHRDLSQPSRQLSLQPGPAEPPSRAIAAKRQRKPQRARIKNPSYGPQGAQESPGRSRITKRFLRQAPPGSSPYLKNRPRAPRPAGWPPAQGGVPPRARR